MKRLVIALLLCVVFSSGAEAKKVTLMSGGIGELDYTLGSDTSSGTPITICQYECTDTTGVFVHARKSMTLNLQVIAGDTTMSLYSFPFDREMTFSVSNICPRFEVVQGTSWTMAWTLESNKGKGRVVDAVELASGTCE